MGREVKVVVGVILKDEQVLIAKRSAKQHQGGLWEFPGGKVESGESELDALARELEEELGIMIITDHCQKRLEIHHQYSDKAVGLHIYWVSDFSGEPQGQEGQLICWVSCAQLADYSFPEANQPILDALQQ
ncbi:8-oxo-dGTP diphosphatase MutT [Celerinatantimonas yamalensis]|uniref:8-oxo-dGTP diphosphatase n=1 Tax=Celerinatantimonas yamalensis TaxID=559956 RepID=A0ABW9G580_9GAMM